jgi:RES domain-containing protein
MRIAWRIVLWRWRDGAFSGEGAALAGGRWNSAGTKVIYLSEHKSLAALETLVHLPRSATARFAFFQVELPAESIEPLPPAALPAGWTKVPPQTDTQAIGDAWVRDQRSAILAVPSVIISEELNYLLNPAHPDFKKIRVGNPQPFTFDPRLF